MKTEVRAGRGEAQRMFVRVNELSVFRWRRLREEVWSGNEVAAVAEPRLLDRAAVQ